MSSTTLMIGNVIGYILQPIFLAYFMINVKSLKNKKLLFMFFVFVDYVFLKCIHKLDYNVNFEILLGIMIFLILKIIYKNKTRITDFITYIISLIFLGITNIPSILLFGFKIYTVIIGNLLAILLTYLLKHKLIYIEKFYNKFWNKHNNKKMLKSVTIRGFSSILTVITFLLLHVWLIYGVYIVRR